MKLSNLSLAILSAIALAACGSSGNDNQTTDPGAGSTPPKQITPPKKITPPKDDEKKDDQQNAAKDKEVVNPTEDPVVDNIDLSDTSTTASQQYIRGKKSNYDNQANPSEPASTTVLSGITLDKQNPQLTNIVIARPQGTNKDGDLVKIAQYAGSAKNQFTSIAGNTNDETLQDLNAPNALVAANNSAGENSFVKLTGNAVASLKLDGNKSFITNNSSVFINPAIKNVNMQNKVSGADLNYGITYTDFLEKLEKYQAAYKDFVDSGADNSKVKALQDAISALLDAKKDSSNQYIVDTTKAAGVANKLILGDYPKYLTEHGITSTDFSVDVVADQSLIVANKLDDVNKDKNPKNFAKITIKVPVSGVGALGSGQYIFTLDGKEFADGGNLTSGGWGDVVKSVKGQDVAVGVEAGTSTDNQGGPTHGLVGIWKQGNSGKPQYIARGTDDNNVRTTRIFGHYYLDPGADANKKAFGDSYNSWAGAAPIVVSWNKDGDPDKYGLAASPITLENVQYGRVTADITSVDFNKEAKSYGWDFRKESLVAHNPKHDKNAVDFYFYRGTNATSIKDMASLPSDGQLTYVGHALMYGIDNNFHGAGDVLPNAFGTAQSYGLGNFVEATFDVGQSKLSGHIYNAWHSPKSDSVYHDNLVNFDGKVVGNTAYGTAELAYDASADKGIFKGSFFGPKAQELGGSVNSVTDKDVYGKGKWGGVFGAQKVGTGTGSAWLVSSQKK